MFLKDGYTFEKDLHPILIKFTELHDTGAMGAYWGKATEVEGMSIVMIGWNSVQVKATSFFCVRFSDHYIYRNIMTLGSNQLIRN